jgi:hypothetical protein
MSRNRSTDIGRLAYDKQSRPPVMCCIVVSHSKPADEVCVNKRDEITVSDCYWECDGSESVYSVVYLEGTEHCDKTRDEILEMERAERHAYLSGADVDLISLPESQIRLRQ